MHDIKDKIIVIPKKVDYTQHPFKVKIILSKIKLGVFFNLIKVNMIFNSPKKYSRHGKDTERMPALADFFTFVTKHLSRS